MKTLRYIDPLSELNTLDATLERLFQPWRPALNQVHDVGMPLAVFEKDGHFVIRASAPGVNPEDIEVSIEAGTLTIRGEFKQEADLSEAKVYCREYAYGAYSRSVRLPENVNVEKVEAEFKNGFVTITLPTLEEEKPKALKVPVKNAQ
jgi:HSP20 family protein